MYRISGNIAIWMCFGWACFTTTNLSAQPDFAYDTIRLGVVTEDGVSYPMCYLDEVEIKGKLPKKWVKKQREYDRLRYNVRKVYPYAVIAAGVLKDVNQHLEALPDKKAKKAYLKSIELELKKKFQSDLENLTISQGQVLVKLINRQTGHDCFSIIKEVKGGFNAVVYQSVALLFSNNLKREYDPEGRDKDIEAIVREIETANYYRFHYFKQQQQQKRTVLQTQQTGAN